MVIRKTDYHVEDQSNVFTVPMQTIWGRPFDKQRSMTSHREELRKETYYPLKRLASLFVKQRHSR